MLSFSLDVTSGKSSDVKDQLNFQKFLKIKFRKFKHLEKQMNLRIRKSSADLILLLPSLPL